MSRAGNWWWTPVAGAIFGNGAIAAAPVTGLGASGTGLLQDEAGWLVPAGRCRGAAAHRPVAA